MYCKICNCNKISRSANVMKKDIRSPLIETDSNYFYPKYFYEISCSNCYYYNYLYMNANQQTYRFFYGSLKSYHFLPLKKLKITLFFYHISIILCVSIQDFFHIYEKSNIVYSHQIAKLNHLPNSSIIISKLKFSMPHPSQFARLQYIDAQNIMSKQIKIYVHMFFLVHCRKSIVKEIDDRLQYASLSHFSPSLKHSLQDLKITNFEHTQTLKPRSQCHNLELRAIHECW